jgi:hypothetical protein
MLDDKLYDPVREILVSSQEAALLDYELPLEPFVAVLVKDDVLDTSKKSDDGEFLML